MVALLIGGQEQDMFGAILEKLGVPVIQAEDIRNGIAAVEHFNPKLIFLDPTLANREGFLSYMESLGVGKIQCAFVVLTNKTVKKEQVIDDTTLKRVLCGCS